MTDRKVTQTVLDLRPNVRYAARVRSVDGLGNKSGWSEAIEFNTGSVNSARPMPPRVVDFEWNEDDAYIGWDPTIFNTDGSVASISHYEFNVMKRELEHGEVKFTLMKTYTVNDLFFTYRLADKIKNEDEAGVHPSELKHLYYSVSAVSTFGVKSAISLDSIREERHPLPPTANPPTLILVGTGAISITTDKHPGVSCVGYTLSYTYDGGANWWLREPTRETRDGVRYTPIGTTFRSFTGSTPAYEFRARIVNAFGQTGASSPLITL